MLKEFNLEKLARTKTGLLSSGEQSRVHLAKALLNQPKDTNFFDSLWQNALSGLVGGVGGAVTSGVVSKGSELAGNLFKKKQKSDTAYEYGP